MKGSIKSQFKDQVFPTKKAAPASAVTAANSNSNLPLVVGYTNVGKTGAAKASGLSPKGE